MSEARGDLVTLPAEPMHLLRRLLGPGKTIRGRHKSRPWGSWQLFRLSTGTLTSRPGRAPSTGSSRRIPEARHAPRLASQLLSRRGAWTSRGLVRFRERTRDQTLVARRPGPSPNLCWESPLGGGKRRLPPTRGQRSFLHTHTPPGESQVCASYD